MVGTTVAERLLHNYKISWARLAPNMYSAQNIINSSLLPGHEISAEAAKFNTVVLEDLVVRIYTDLSKEYNYTIGLPYASSTEFVAALCLAYLNEQLFEEVALAIDGKFSFRLGALGISDAPDKAVVSTGRIPIRQWNELYRVLQQHDPWVQYHRVFSEKRTN